AMAHQASASPTQVPLSTPVSNNRHSTRHDDRAQSPAGVPGITEVLYHETTNYPLTVAVDDAGDGFGITVDAVAPADPELVCGLLCTAVASLAAMLQDAPATPLRRAQVLGGAERARGREGWK